MRTMMVGVVLVAFAGVVVAQPGVHTSDEGKYRAKFGGAPKQTSQTAKTALGELTVHVATYANSDGGIFMISYTDFPAAATKPENKATLFDGIRDGVAGGKGTVVIDKDFSFGPDKLLAREFTVDKEKGKQRIRSRVILRDNRVYQIAVIGSPEFANGKDATAFLESLDLTK